MRCAGAAGRKADHPAQEIRVGGLLQKVLKGHSFVGHRRFLGCVEFATRPYRRIDDDRRKPLARYGAMGSALRERLAPAELHHKLGHGPSKNPRPPTPLGRRQSRRFWSGLLRGAPKRRGGRALPSALWRPASALWPGWLCWEDRRQNSYI